MAFVFLVFLIAIVCVGMILKDANILGTGTASYINSTAATSYTLIGVPGTLLILAVTATVIFALLLFATSKSTRTKTEQLTIHERV